MDKTTYEVLKEIISFEQANEPSDHPDAHYHTFFTSLETFTRIPTC